MPTGTRCRGCSSLRWTRSPCRHSAAPPAAERADRCTPAAAPPCRMPPGRTRPADPGSCGAQSHRHEGLRAGEGETRGHRQCCWIGVGILCTHISATGKNRAAKLAAGHRALVNWSSSAHEAHVPVRVGTHGVADGAGRCAVDRRHNGARSLPQQPRRRQVRVVLSTQPMSKIWARSAMLCLQATWRSKGTASSGAARRASEQDG